MNYKILNHQHSNSLYDLYSSEIKKKDSFDLSEYTQILQTQQKFVTNSDNIKKVIVFYVGR